MRVCRKNDCESARDIETKNLAASVGAQEGFRCRSARQWYDVKDTQATHFRSLMLRFYPTTFLCVRCVSNVCVQGW